MIDLYTAFSQIKDKREFWALMSDLCTPTELRFLQERWRIAQMLATGQLSQRDISNKNKFAVGTITRVSHNLFESKSGGYRTIMNRLGIFPPKRAGQKTHNVHRTKN